MSENILKTNAEEKHFFVGITLASNSNTDTGVAILDKNLKIINLDKLYSMTDVRYFIDNFPGKKNTVFIISIPENPTIINTKWKLQSRPYQLVKSNKMIKNIDDWCERFSGRGCDYFSQQKDKGVDIFRVDIRELKHSLGLSPIYKEHTPSDCKHIQNVLRVGLKMRELPSNMIPIAQLEAVLSATLAHKMVNSVLDEDYKIIFDYNGIEVIGLCQ